MTNQDTKTKINPGSAIRAIPDPLWKSQAKVALPQNHKEGKLNPTKSTYYAVISMNGILNGLYCEADNISEAFSEAEAKACEQERY